MADDKSKQQWGTMREDRPLDALFPELTAPSAPNDLAPGEEASDVQTAPSVHPGVLEVELEGAQEWTLAIWGMHDPVEVVLGQLRRQIEATLLLELSRPPGWGGVAERRMHGIHLFAFDVLPEAMKVGLGALGFEEVTYDQLQYGNRMHAWQNEAKRGGWKTPAHPMSLWWAPFMRGGDLAGKLREVHEEVATRLGNRVWGQQPGTPSHVMASVLERHVNVSIKPGAESLHELDMLLVDRTPAKLRWVEPMLFQALCDFIGVSVMAARGGKIQWATCESDREGGHFPPLFRLTRGRGPSDVQVGLLLLRAIIMPFDESAGAPLLRDWYARHFVG